MSGGKYERELKSIMQGEDLDDHTKTLPENKEEIYRKTEDKPFLVSRGAGSFDIDLILMRGKYYFPTEVKSSKDEIKYFSDDPRLTEQVEDYIETSRKCDLPILYARRMKGVRGEKWEIYRIRTDATRKRCWTIPSIPQTRNGTRKLEWGQGLPLSTFLDIIYRNEEEQG